MLDKWDKAVKIIVGFCTLLTVAWAAGSFLDSRYAHAEEVERTINKQGIFVQSSYIEVRQEMVNDRIRQLEALRHQGKATDFDLTELKDKKETSAKLQERLEVLKREMLK